MKTLLLSLALLAPPQTLRAADANSPDSDPKDRVEEITPFTLVGEAGKFRLEVKADGALSHNGQKLGTLGVDGVVLDTKGKELAKLKGDGTVETKDGKAIGKILANGDLEFGAEAKATWAKGRLTLASGGAVAVLEPDKPGNRRRAAIVLLLFLTALPQPP